jgi:fused signal recognition particle receptor
MGWLENLRKGLSSSARKLEDNVSSVLTGTRRLDDAVADDLMDTLLAADIGAPAAQKLVDAFRAVRFGTDITEADARQHFATAMTAMLEPVARPLPECYITPRVIMLVGVNGSGKTTTAGKLAQQFREQGKTIAMVAGDTFRAGAIEQLQVWGNRVRAPVYFRPEGSDAAALVYDSWRQAQAQGIDVLMVDTAGRLHNKENLMAELEKIGRVLKKLDETAPHDCLLVLDATVGQTAHSQVELFRKAAPLTGLVVTKLDGTARAGVVVALAEKFGLPIPFIGVGEKVEDLHPFEAADFASSLLGVSDEKAA